MNLSARRVLQVTVPGLVLGLGLAYAFWPRPLPVDLASVARGDIRVTIDDEGKTRVKDVYVVSAPVSGRLLRVERKVGDAVTAGETVLAVIQPADPSFLDRRSEQEAQAALRAAEAAQALAEAELTRSRADLDLAETELKRARALASRGTISPSTLDRAEAEVKKQKANVAMALAARQVKRHELETARARLIAPVDEFGVGGAEATCCSEIRAPVDGRVLRLLRESEGVVLAGTPLIEIGDPAKLEIVADLLSSEAVKVKVGDAVLIEDWGGAAPVRGRVTRVEPFGFTKVSALGIEEQRVNVIIDFTSPPETWRALGHGYRVDVRIVVAEATGVLLAPIGALFRDGNAWACFVEQDGRARKRIVKVGHMNEHEAEIASGLEAGARLVLHPGDRIDDGVRIVARAP